MRTAALSLAAMTLGVVALGATACNDDGAADAADTPAASPSASGSAPAPPSTPSAVPTPTWSFKRHKVTGNQVIMIDPDGKKYTRKTMIQMAAGMAAVNEKHGLPSDFCDRSYVQGIKGGGTFPAGKAAFIEACKEGVRLANQH